MASKIPEDVAYTITTGYYPEIASKIKYKKKINELFSRCEDFED